MTVKKNTLKTIAVLGLLTNNVENGIDELGSFCVVAFGPVVSCTGLSEDEVIRAKDLSIRAASDAVHSPRLEIHEHSSWYIPPTARLVVVYIHPLQLNVCIAMVASCGVNPMLCADHFPELGADLVAALAGLDVQDLTHCSRKGKGSREKRREKGERRKEQKRRLAMAMAMAEKP